MRSLSFLLLIVGLTSCSSSSSKGAKDGGTTENCTTGLCAGDSDCTAGTRCNTRLAKPSCQTLYCGGEGTPCGGSDPAALCSSRICNPDGTCGAMGSQDMRSGPLPLDFAGQPPLTCTQIEGCLGNCTTPMCTNECFVAGSPTARSDISALENCLQTACPGAGAGTTCVTTAESGACASENTACQNDQT